MEILDNKVIYAAGGIVWKKISGTHRIALIYRERYGGKWSLPKGKLEEQESWEEAALREVKEEVGVKAKIINYAGTINYRAEGVPKVVIFWHMKATGNKSFPHDSEVVQIDWLTPKEASKKIDYEEERDLISGLQVPETDLTERTRKGFKYLNPMHYLSLLKGAFKNKSKLNRLKGDLITFRTELNYLISRDKKDNKTPAWGIKAVSLLDSADQQLQNNNIDIAWKNYNASLRLTFYSLDENGLREQAKIIRAEAKKLNKWRTEAVFSLIGTVEKPNLEVDADTLTQAAKIRDGHYNNMYHKNQMVQKVFTTLLLFMVSTIALICVYFYFIDVATLIQPSGTEGVISTNYVWIIIGVLLFGVLGGCVSSLFHIRDSSTVTRIPEVINDNFITSVRVLIGGGSALAIFIILQSGFIQFFNENIIVDLEPDNPFTYFTIAFVAGFTERLLLKAISSIIGDDQK